MRFSLRTLLIVLVVVPPATAILWAWFHTENFGFPTRKLPAFHGQSRAQVVSQLGQPSRDDKYTMSEAAGEFRVELQNTYPLSNPANENVKIEEMTWQDGSYWITLWLHQVNGQWVVLTHVGGIRMFASDRGTDE